MRVGFIGLGRMGHHMARHIAAAGHELISYDVLAVARQRAANAGLVITDSSADLAGSEIICSSLPDTAIVEAAYLGSEGIGSLLAPGTVCIDLSTISVSGSRAIAETLGRNDIRFVDGPVSGTSIHAEAATLVVMAGGDDAAVERARPILETFSSRVDRVGSNGSGLQLKLITNRLLTTHLAAFAEAIVLLERTELSVPQAIELLRAGAVPRLLDYKASPLANRDYSPQFTVDLMRKDLRLAAEALPDSPLGVAAHDIVEATSQAGFGNDDLAAIIEVIEARIDGMTA